MDLWTNVPDPTTHPKISVTEARDLLRCTQKHAYSYRQGLQPATSPTYFGKGRYYHHLWEAFLQSHVEGAAIFDVGTLSRRVLAAMRQQHEEGDPAATVEEPDRLEVDAIFKDMLAAPAMIALEPVAIEQEFYADLGWRDHSGRPVLLHGFIDALIRGPDGLWIVEHKTAGRAWSQGQFAFDYQSRLYTSAVEAVTDFGRPAGTLFNFAYPKRWETKQVFVTPEESALLIAELQRVIDLRDLGVVVRQPHWGCNDCSFRTLCHAELIGADSQYIRDTQYLVNQDKVARFEEVDV